MGPDARGSKWICEACGKFGVSILAPWSCYVLGNRGENGVMEVSVATGFQLSKEIYFHYKKSLLWCPRCKKTRKPHKQKELKFLELLKQIPSVKNPGGFEELLAQYEPSCPVCGTKLKAGLDDSDICPHCNNKGKFKFGGLWMS